MIKYYSTAGKSDNVSFKDAVLSGLAPDRGLYMPEEFKKYTDGVFTQDGFSNMCFEIAKTLIDNELPDNTVREIVDDAFNFPVPVKNIHDNIYVLELYHGPTAAFKDFGARFMARTMSHLIKQDNKKITILVATSGDTGSAVARGFYKVPNIDVVILYPQGKVSNLQEKQLTTLGENITALEVKGTFDDCQHMVKEAFMDQELNTGINLSSANSINIARLLPQSFYYTWAYRQVVKDSKKPVIFCTPSGNFGNLTAGLIAKIMGLPVEFFIAATNVNDVVPEYLQTGDYRPRPSILTYSNAMDVGNPSNFDRMLDIYKNKQAMEKDVKGYKATDEETVAIIKEVYEKYDYILDPHGAVGYKAITDFYKDHDEYRDTPVILLETAHPAKFGETIKKSLNIDVEIPEVLKEAMEKEKHSIEIDNTYQSLKDYLLKRD